MIHTYKNLGKQIPKFEKFLLPIANCKPCGQISHYFNDKLGRAFYHIFWEEIRHISPIQEVMLSPLDPKNEILPEKEKFRPSSVVHREIFDDQNIFPISKKKIFNNKKKPNKKGEDDSESDDDKGNNIIRLSPPPTPPLNIPHGNEHQGNDVLDPQDNEQDLGIISEDNISSLGAASYFSIENEENNDIHYQPDRAGNFTNSDSETSHSTENWPNDNTRKRKKIPLRQKMLPPVPNTDNTIANPILELEYIQPSGSAPHSVTGARPKTRSNISYITKDKTKQKSLQGSVKTTKGVKSGKSASSAKKSQVSQDFWKQHPFWQSVDKISSTPGTRSTRKNKSNSLKTEDDQNPDLSKQYEEARKSIMTGYDQLSNILSSSSDEKLQVCADLLQFLNKRKN